MLDSKEHPDWTAWLVRRYVVRGRALPEGLKVGGWLSLSGCTGLTALPEGLTVGGDLSLRGTPLGDRIGAQDWMTLAEVRDRIKAKERA